MQAPDKISVGSFVCIKEDVTATSYDIMNDEDARGKEWKMTMTQGAMKKGSTEELNLSYLHQHPH